MTSDSTRDYERLGERARARRADLGLPLTDATAKAGGMSKHTWQRVERGLPIREINYVKIEEALGWTPGSCLRIIDGGDPALADAIQVAPVDVDRRARDVVQLAIIATAEGTTAEQIREISDRVVQDLRKCGLI